MKFATVFAAAMFSLVSASAVAKHHRPVSVLAVRNDLFYFKVDKAFKGAIVEVYSSSGKLLLTDTVKHHKMLIDFYDKGQDNYTIKIKGRGGEVDFLYMKFDPAGVDAFKPVVQRI